MTNNQSNGRTAGDIAMAVQTAMRSAGYNPGTAALVTVLGRWIAERSPRPQMDVSVWSAVLEVLVEEIARHHKPKGGMQDVAA
jgi:hypothetical protein